MRGVEGPCHGRVQDDITSMLYCRGEFTTIYSESQVWCNQAVCYLPLSHPPLMPSLIPSPIHFSPMPYQAATKPASIAPQRRTCKPDFLHASFLAWVGAGPDYSQCVAKVNAATLSQFLTSFHPLIYPPIHLLTPSLSISSNNKAYALLYWVVCLY